MSEEELDAAGALAVDEDQDEVLEELSLEERKERLKKARWNVFLYLGVAAIMFFFALFPVPFSAQPNGQTYEQDLKFVWGLPIDGEDFTDVPIKIEIKSTEPPADPYARIAVYLLNSDDCDSSEILRLKTDARDNPTHDYQFQITDKVPFADENFVFEFNVDGGGQCVFAEYVHKDDLEKTLPGVMEVDGSMWPNQIWAGFIAIVCLSLSGFAFVGAQRHGGAMRKLLEGENESTESKVLSEASRARIAAGPGGPPQAGPSGPPPSEGPSEPPAETAPAEPPAEASEPTEAPPAAATPAASQPEGTFEPAENGYFFRKMPDGTYDQTVYVQNEDGSYVPHEG
ncbi:MAG: hypothetical protein CMA86_07455 [Euryarchaeota archaeon]|nr:hypothetical protein [Euryarchaeota archaeon]